jgi:hypothetical protein
LDWIIIRDYANREIGAVGFIGKKAAIVAAFYDDADADFSGRVDAPGEWIPAAFMPKSAGGPTRAETMVAMAASVNTEVLARDPSFGDAANRLWLSFARGLIVSGVYDIYLEESVRQAARAVARRATDRLIKRFVVRRGMEKEVQAACGRMR